MQDTKLEILSNMMVTDGVFKLDLKSETPLPQIISGQFLHLEVPDKTLLLRRPFCIYQYTSNTLTTFYAMVGKGTKSLSDAKKGDYLKAILPLGNGFDISNYKKIALIGGGMGCAELFNVTKTKNKEFYAYFGFSNKQRVLFEEDFLKTTKSLKIYTSDGSYGIKGHCTDQIENEIDKFDAVLLCGPIGMVKQVAKITQNKNVPVFVSLEQRMGCGVGACLVCTCEIKDADLQVKNKRVCVDGPVFNLKDVVL